MSQIVRPRLPFECILMIIEASDPAALAVLGAVSFDVLEASSHLLYKEVEIQSLSSLEQLFCERQVETSVSPSRISSHLSLSQIQSLHLNFSSLLLGPTHPLLSLPFFKAPELAPLPIDTLRISYDYQRPDLLVSFHTYLLPHLNPLRITYDTQRRPSLSRPVADLWTSPLLSGWTRIEEIEMKGAFVLIGSTGALAALPPPTMDRRRVLRLHLYTLLAQTHNNASQFLALAQQYMVAPLGLGSMQDGSIIWVVGSEREKKEVEEAVGSLPEGRRGVFAVELEVKRISTAGSISTLFVDHI